MHAALCGTDFFGEITQGFEISVNRARVVERAKSIYEVAQALDQVVELRLAHTRAISITPYVIALYPPSTDPRTVTYTTKTRDRQSRGLGGRTFADIELTPLVTEVRCGHLFGGSPLCYEAIAFVG